MQSIIEISGVSKLYRQGADVVRALDGVSLSVTPGEFVSILGESGSGKSTLMNIIGGLDKSSRGQVLVEGDDLSRMNDRQMSRYRNKTVGFVFQNFNLDGSLTALENVMLPLMYADVRREQRRKQAALALERVGLSDRMHHLPSQLSGGQKQRVSMARAIVNHPKIILADEPTGNLDVKSGRLVILLLRELNSMGYTILMVTHNRQQANTTDRIIEISDGRIIKDTAV